MEWCKACVMKYWVNKRRYLCRFIIFSFLLRWIYFFHSLCFSVRIFFLLVEEDEDVWKKKMGKKKYLMEKKMCATGKTFIPSWKTLRKWWRCEMVLVVDDGNVIHVFCANKRFLLVAWLGWLLAKKQITEQERETLSLLLSF